MLDELDAGRHGARIESVRLKGGRFDGTTIEIPHAVVKLTLEDVRYYRTHRRPDGLAEFTHESIWGRA